MKTYEFALILSHETINIENLEDKLYEAGCDDALISYILETPPAPTIILPIDPTFREKIRGSDWFKGLPIKEVQISFRRSADFIWEAVESAIEDVEKVCQVAGCVSPNKEAITEKMIDYNL
jgi:hypothetical protein